MMDDERVFKHSWACKGYRILTSGQIPSLDPQNMFKILTQKISSTLDSNGDNLPSRLFNRLLIFLILLNISLYVVSTMEHDYKDTERALHWITNFSYYLFGLEYLFRLYIVLATPLPTEKKPFIQRIKLLSSPLMITDLLAIAPFFMGLDIDLIILRVFRLLKIMRITQYSPALELLAKVIKRENKTLFTIFLLIGILLIITSWGIYLAEHKAQPEAFSSIPNAMWWAMATLSTVGYGDIVPITLPGKIFGVIVMLIGIGMFAVPTGVLVNGFAREVKRRDFIATWNLVAHVPFFSRLSATEIAAISDLLHLKTVMPNEIIFRKNDEADAMYFIVEGMVEVDLGTKQLRLSKGDFFGEVSLLYGTPRTGTVTSLTLTELLCLDARNLDSFLESNHGIRDKIAAEASKRLENDSMTSSEE